MSSDLGPLLLLEEESKTFTFTGLKEAPVVSLLRNFSAPVKLQMERSEKELAFLAANDSDPFNRWDAGQTLAAQIMIHLASEHSAGNELKCPETIRDSFGALLNDGSIDEAFKAAALALPSETVVGQEMSVCNPDALHAAREFLRKSLATEHETTLQAMYEELASDGAYQNDQKSINRRKLKTRLLSYLAALAQPQIAETIASQYNSADNMTDKIGALELLVDLDVPARDEALADFYALWQHDPLVLDKWFIVQAGSQRSDTVQQVQTLLGHERFDPLNPNRARALLGAFATNQAKFHTKDGAGYQLVADAVMQIDNNNPQLAARLVSAFNSIRRFDAERQTLMRQQLERIQAKDGLSNDVFEIVERALKF